jgi:hypothetical protein
MKKIVVGGLLAGLAIVVVGFIVGSLTGNLYAISNASMWKPMGKNFVVMMFIYDLMVGLILSYVYSIIKSSVPGSVTQKGLIFGLLIWLVGTLPGMGITYLTMNVRNMLIAVWTVNGLLNYLLAGAAIQWADEKLN